MEYLAVSIYIECFAGTCFKKKISHFLIYVYTCVHMFKLGNNKRTLLTNKKGYFYNIVMICEKY
jgi:hypothetical protein